MSEKIIYLHMGLHKTGTTSIQEWLGANKAILEKWDVSFYRGQYHPNNHIELGLSSLRENLDAPIKRSLGFDRDRIFSETKSRLESFVSTCEESNIVISNETISFIRHRGEIDRLRSVLPNGIKIVPVIFLRPKGDWLESYRKQMMKMGIEESDDKESCSYFQPNTWLLQHETLVELTRQSFGDCRIVDYNGASVNQFLSAIGIEVEVEEPKINVSSKRSISGGVSRVYCSIRKLFWFN